MLYIEHCFFRLFVFLLSFFHFALARRDCYWFDGSKVIKPYDACQARDSICCWKGDICLSNNLCFSLDTSLVRTSLLFLLNAADRVLRLF